ncbi:MAG: molecular chaperone GrpE [Parcubacteria group bacterium Gr01-1014_3]|nr:MAG: molecular chaperone GrpE [Parcubacteria group bacterium Gr01-1014_3]
MDDKKTENLTEEYLNGWKRAKADLINYQKDEQKRFEEFAKFANISIIKDLVGSLDNFDLAIAALEKQGPVDKGIYMIRSQIADTLKRQGVEAMIVEAGGTFDPSFHEAVGEMESDHPPGSIAEVLEQGYILNGKVIKPVRIKLSKGQNK